MATPTGITLSLNGTDYDVISCNYFFNQGLGQDGRPNGSVNGGQIQLSIMSTEDTALVEWMCSPSKSNDGTITFYQPDDPSKTMKKLEFKRGYCVSFSESFSSGPSGSQSLAITANEITIGNAEINNEWPS
ncbi:MAG: type VI secretion system tube protein TssD [Ferruginibacter sp.]